MVQRDARPARAAAAHGSRRVTALGDGSEVHCDCHSEHSRSRSASRALSRVSPRRRKRVVLFVDAPSFVDAPPFVDDPSFVDAPASAGARRDRSGAPDGSGSRDASVQRQPPVTAGAVAAKTWAGVAREAVRLLELHDHRFGRTGSGLKLT